METSHGESASDRPHSGTDNSQDDCLDLTSYQLHDLEDIELSKCLVELDLTANRLRALDARIGELSRLKKLCLRQNLINDDGGAPLCEWTAISQLEELVLRDNKLTRVPDASIFKNLLVFDVSFNEITSLSGLSVVSPTLKELYVSKNDVSKIEELEHLHELQILELGSNRLRIIITFSQWISSKLKIPENLLQSKKLIIGT